MIINIVVKTEPIDINVTLLLKEKINLKCVATLEFHSLEELNIGIALKRNFLSL